MASSRNERSTLVYTGLVFALINIVTAWALIAHRSWILGKLLTRTPAGAPDRMGEEADVQGELLKEVPAVLRTVQNGFYIHYNMDLIALAVAFCFFGVGFSLVIMGKNAAIEARADGKDIGSVMVKTTSPGLFCFLMATIVVALTMLRGGFIPDGIFGSGGNGYVETSRDRAEADLLHQQAAALQKATWAAGSSSDFAEGNRIEAEAAWYRAKTQALGRLLTTDLPPSERSAVLQALLGVTPQPNNTTSSDAAPSSATGSE